MFEHFGVLFILILNRLIRLKRRVNNQRSTREDVCNHIFAFEYVELKELSCEEKKYDIIVLNTFIALRPHKMYTIIIPYECIKL